MLSPVASHSGVLQPPLLPFSEDPYPGLPSIRFTGLKRVLPLSENSEPKTGSCLSLDSEAEEIREEVQELLPRTWSKDLPSRPVPGLLKRETESLQLDSPAIFM